MKKDEHGHLHGADGKFTSEGKGDGAPKAKEEKKAPEAPKQTKEEKLEAAKAVFEDKGNGSAKAPEAKEAKGTKDAKKHWIRSNFTDWHEVDEEEYNKYRESRRNSPPTTHSLDADELEEWVGLYAQKGEKAPTHDNGEKTSAFWDKVRSKRGIKNKH